MKIRSLDHFYSSLFTKFLRNKLSEYLPLNIMGFSTCDQYLGVQYTMAVKINIHYQNWKTELIDLCKDWYHAMEVIGSDLISIASLLH